MIKISGFGFAKEIDRNELYFDPRRIYFAPERIRIELNELYCDKVYF
jgi:hypothetical protein